MGEHLMGLFGSNNNAAPKQESPKQVKQSKQDIETIIGKNTKIIGQIIGEANIRVDGHIDGGIDLLGDVVVGETGSVVGNVKVKNLVLAGSLVGNVITEEGLSIQSTGQLIGDVQVHSLSIAEGAVFKGKSDMVANIPLPEQNNFLQDSTNLLQPSQQEEME